jgi:hypothetical protein
MPDYVLTSCGIDGVKYAVPLSSASLSNGMTKLSTGHRPGPDDTISWVAPTLNQDIFGDNAFIVVKDNEFPNWGTHLDDVPIK